MPKITFTHQFFLDIADLRDLQSDWLRASWLITEEPEFSQIWGLCMHKTNNMNFHLTPDPEYAVTNGLRTAIS